MTNSVFCFLPRQWRPSYANEIAAAMPPNPREMGHKYMIVRNEQKEGNENPYQR